MERLNCLKIVTTRSALILICRHISSCVALAGKCKEVRVLTRIERQFMSMRKLSAGFLLIFSLLNIIAPNSAIANSLTSTTPVSGATLSIAPSNVTLTVESPLSDMGSQISVIDPKGNKVDDGAITIDGTNAVVGLLPLTESGTYTVSYSLITDNDSPLEGSFTFTYTAPDKISPSKPTDSKNADQTRSSTFGTTVFVIIVGLMGLIVFFALILYARKIYRER